MFRKYKGLRISLLIVLGLTTLSCDGIEGIEAFHIADWLCEGTGGTWVVTGEMHRGKCDRTKKDQANAEGIIINSDAEEEALAAESAPEPALAPDTASELDSSPDEALAPLLEPLPEAESDVAAPAVVEALPGEGDPVEQPQANEVPESEVFFILPGTYTGKTNLPEITNRDRPKDVVEENKITLVVAEDGSIMGEVISKFYYNNTYATGTTRDTHWEISGVFDDTLTDSEDTLKIIYTQRVYVTGSDCSPFCGDKTIEYSQWYTLTYSSGTLSGSDLSEATSFEATGP